MVIRSIKGEGMEVMMEVMMVLAIVVEVVAVVEMEVKVKVLREVTPRKTVWIRY